jgi:mannose-6-phosphate isomerase-like protein (cupin superfamily)
MSAGESVTLPAGSKLHIENPQDERLQMVQIAVDGGSHCSEPWFRFSGILGLDRIDDD